MAIRKRKIFKRMGLAVLFILVLGFLIPQDLQMPVAAATAKDYHPDTFWYYPWGRSVTHKGVDVFAKKGTSVKSSTSGIVLYTGDLSLGGKVILALGPQWRLHYYAHLDEILTSSFSLLHQGEKIATVGDSGNAKGKEPHLHYSMLTMIPYPWRIDGDKQGWKKMFFLNPIKYWELE
ncbi:MAG: M23 family metallopeptidase [Bacteroidota bacterium]